MDDSLGNTLIIAPPRHAKTTWLMIYCLWWLGKHPEGSVGYISNTATQAQRQSMAIRDTVLLNKMFQAVFPGIKPDEKRKWAADEWFLEREDILRKDASLTASGTPGPVLGSEFNLVIFDDVCDQENMESERQRLTTVDWLATTAMSRLSPNGRAICIMTRWHHADFAAWCIDHGWHVIHMPAIDEEGEPLWPEEWSLERLMARRRELDMTPWKWEAMYQGRPTPEAGAIFKREWFKYYNEVPDLVHRVCSWDTAFKAKEHSAYTVGATFGIDGSGNVYILDVMRRRMEYPELKRMILVMGNEWNTATALVEDSASGQSAIQELKNIPEINIIPITPRRDKTARANALAAMFESGRMYLPSRSYQGEHGIHWVGAYESELLECPSGTYWDQVDATSQFADWYRERALGRPQPVKVKICA